jgi:hypothetical protein
MAIVDRFHTFKARLTRQLARRSFHFLERHLDLHLTANEYYSPIPSVKDLPADVYDRPFSMLGVDMNEAGQLDLLDTTFSRYADEYVPQPNGGLSLADAFALYALIRDRKPRKIVEIGGGDSTLISMQAVEKNRAEGFPCHFTCIEPYPRQFLREASWPDYELVTKLVQDVPVTMFADADIVFIDSSHVSKIGSDVNYEFLEIVPNTKVGCLIHWHDIVLPTNYWKDWTELSGQFWNESYMLHAFLLYNSAFSVRWAARYMQRLHPDRLQKRLPYLTSEHRLTSFWAERVA